MNRPFRVGDTDKRDVIEFDQHGDPHVVCKTMYETVAEQIVRDHNEAQGLREALEGMLEWARRVKQSNPGPEIINALAALRGTTEKEK